MIEMTVLFATRNGETVLPRTLEGYVSQNAVPVEWKLVIVDNGSTDRTVHIIEEFQDRLKIDLLYEATAGKNRALNVGLQAIEGEAIIISDDDTIPQPDFLAAWHDVFVCQQSFDIFGGVIEPLFDVAPPKWMSQGRIKFEELFGARNLSEGPVDPGEIFGGNMAVRRSVFAKGLKFAESIGPDGADQNYAMGSETEFCVRAFSHGHKAWFARRPLVSHIVRPHELEPKSWSRRAYRNGRGKAQMLCNKERPVSRLGYSGAALAGRTAYKSFQRYLRWVRTLTSNPEKRLDASWNYHWNRGFNDEYAKQMKLFLNIRRNGNYG